MNKKTLLLGLVGLAGTCYGAVTITTPTVNTGELIRAGDWNKIRADLVTLSSTLEILGNQTWQSSGGDMYYLNGPVGAGIATPPAQLSVFKDAPVANESMFQIGTALDANKFKIDEDGDTQMDGTLLVRGGTVYDSSGSLEVNGEDNVYVGIDWNDNDADNRAFIVGKNDAGPGDDWEELMRVTESGRVGIGTNNPSLALEVVGSGDQLLSVQRAGLSKKWALGANADRFFVTNSTDGVISMTLSNSGNVGIGTTTPSSALEVAGTIRAEEICDESGANCQDVSSGWADESLGVPAGAVMPFNLTTCPSGWSEFTAAQGRSVFGREASNAKFDSLGETGGTETHTLTAGEMPSHNHSVDPPSTTSSSIGNHSHWLDPPATYTTAGGNHRHSATDGNAQGGEGYAIDGSPNGSGVRPLTGYAGNHNHLVNIGGFSSYGGGGHGHTVNIGSFNSGSAGSGQAHNNLPPYVALLYCEKD